MTDQATPQQTTFGNAIQDSLRKYAEFEAARRGPSSGWFFLFIALLQAGALFNFVQFAPA